MKPLTLALVIILLSASACAPRYLVQKDSCRDAGEHWLCDRVWTVR